MKLFSAHSIRNGFRGYDEVKIHWFRCRKQPVAPYEELIADYAELEDWEEPYAQEAINEYFTAEEVKLLKIILWVKFGRKEVEITEIPLPTPAKDIIPANRAIPLGGMKDVLILSDGSGPLPFGVEGYYDLSYCPRAIPPDPELEEWDEILTAAFLDKQFGISGVEGDDNAL